jgi:hypothetical protein
MHGLNLGVTQHVLGNCIFDIAVSKAELRKDIPAALEALWEDICDACVGNAHGIEPVPHVPCFRGGG